MTHPYRVEPPDILYRAPAFPWQALAAAVGILFAVFMLIATPMMVLAGGAAMSAVLH